MVKNSINSPSVVVIGSGLSALACTQALVERGIKITLFDAGEKAPQNVSSLIDRMKWATPDQWLDEDRVQARENKTARSSKIPKKTFFGSDYVFTQGVRNLATDYIKCEVAYTLAKGGFSNVWGAAMLPAADIDTVDWPFRRSDLSDYYKKVLNHMPLSADHDAIEGEFPLYKDQIAPVTLGPQGQILLRTFNETAHKLARKGILAGRPRLAVHAQSNELSPGCDGCGLCLTGCPREAIFNASSPLQTLIKNNQVTYKTGRIVLSVKETDGGATVAYKNTVDNHISEETFDRVFIGCGALNSTRIIMNSIGHYDRPAILRESQKFIVPFLRPSGNNRLFDEPNFALPNGLFVTKYGADYPHWSQMQLSPASDLVFQSLGLNSSDMSKPYKWLASQLLGRLIIGWGSLHSAQSSHMNLTLDAKSARLTVTGIENPAFKPAGSDILRRLFWATPLTRTLPISWMIRFAPPGHGNHVGASLPMSVSPSSALETDLLGRPAGWQRIHVIDTAVFPSVPGTTVSLTAMANAWRIAEAVDL